MDWPWIIAIMVGLAGVSSGCGDGGPRAGLPDVDLSQPHKTKVNPDAISPADAKAADAASKVNPAKDSN